ncbi:calcium-binding protein [Actinoplanes oblitus]|uniref:Calcium-binding protein n=1 Tax=Actinoplanes oblitus TaxID=3040509 RepID=A0ABY8WIH6_9ACTN|nr:calcium-binding protein [Actinoplanes oblitus]WIM96687.1 calcium-binding protein [Actinoplanes oblitus]
MFLTSRKALATIGATAVAVAAATTLFAAPAQAATAGLARVSGTTVKFNALMTKSNSLVITVSGRTVTLDDKVAIKAGKGCKAVRGDKTKVKCTTSSKPKKLIIALGDKNDRVVNKTGIYMLADGGTGDDTLYGGSGADQLQGASGNDKLYGNNGNDKLFGENGNDFLVAGAGNDDIYAGAGNDRAYGYAGNDRIAGEAGNDAIYGGVGNDTIVGLAGNDSLSGEDGADVIFGDDYKAGPYGADSISGGNGNDILLGGSGSDKLYGGNHDDTLYGAYANQDSGAPYGTTGSDYLAGGNNGTRGDYCLTVGAASYNTCEYNWTTASVSALDAESTHPRVPADVKKRLADASH